jgi:hypothetical protein
MTSLQARWNQSVEAAAREMPRYYMAPPYVNPFYALTASLTRPHQKFPDWLISALVFVALGLLAAFLAFRNIRRRGESG